MFHSKTMLKNKSPKDHTLPKSQHPPNPPSAKLNRLVLSFHFNFLTMPVIQTLEVTQRRASGAQITLQ